MCDKPLLPPHPRSAVGGVSTRVAFSAPLQNVGAHDCSKSNISFSVMDTPRMRPDAIAIVYLQRSKARQKLPSLHLNHSHLGVRPLWGLDRRPGGWKGLLGKRRKSRKRWKQHRRDEARGAGAAVPGEEAILHQRMILSLFRGGVSQKSR